MLLGFLRQGAKPRGSKVLCCTDLRNQKSSGNVEVFQVLVTPVANCLNCSQTPGIMIMVTGGQCAVAQGIVKRQLCRPPAG